MSTRYKILAVVGTLAFMLIAARLALPAAVKSYVNSRIAEMGEYSGHAADIDIALIRGAYQIQQLVIEKRAADTDAPFLNVDEVDISLQWSALLSGALVGEIVARRPIVYLVQATTNEDTQLGRGVNWTAEIRELFPFKFNSVEALDGRVTFRAPGIDEDEILTLSDTHLKLENLTNVQNRTQEAFAALDLKGRIMSDAPFTVTGKINPNATQPTFDINVELQRTMLVDVNPWLQRFLRIDAEQGTFSLYSELAAEDGSFVGYVKPIMEDAEFFDVEELNENPLRNAWEALVDFAGEIFENQSSDQIATQIPLSGDIEDPDAGTLAAIVNVIRNAFVVAFSHSIDGTISIRDVQSDPDSDSDTKHRNGSG